MQAVARKVKDFSFGGNQYEWIRKSSNIHNLQIHLNISNHTSFENTINTVL